MSRDTTTFDRRKLFPPMRDAFWGWDERYFIDYPAFQQSAAV